ncbi:histone acetyltransferase [Conglomerata obtusa]
MPKEYIFRQVHDPKHKCLIMLYEDRVIGGICYRPFYNRYFAEVVFCAVDGDAQIQGYGGYMMDFFMEHVKTEGWWYWYTKHIGCDKDKCQGRNGDGDETVGDRNDVKVESSMRFDVSRENINTHNGKTITLSTSIEKENNKIGCYEDKSVEKASNEDKSLEKESNENKQKDTESNDAINNKMNENNSVKNNSIVNNSIENNTVINNINEYNSVINNINENNNIKNNKNENNSIESNSIENNSIKNNKNENNSIENSIEDIYNGHKNISIISSKRNDIINNTNKSQFKELLGFDTETYTKSSTEYLNPMYTKLEYPVYLMTYADNYAIGYFKKNGFSTDITFKNWIGCIKDYDGGTMMQCKIIWEINYILKDEFLDRMRNKLINKISKKSEFNVIREGIRDRKFASPYDIPGVKEAKLTNEMLSKKSRDERLTDILKFFLNDLQAHSSAWPFLVPVKKSEVPDYYIIIQKPMDLNTMENKLNNGEYKNIELFSNDFSQIIKNCFLYNAPTTQYYKCAQKLEEYFLEKICLFNEK